MNLASIQVKRFDTIKKVNLREYQTSFELEETHWWYRGQRYLLGQFLKNYFEDRRDLKILDIGCGTGINFTVLDAFGDVQGIDISDTAQEYCAKRGYEILIESVMDLPFPRGYFDVVTSLGVFYHREVADDLKGMREIYKILKPGGKLFFFDSAMDCLSSNHDIVFHGVRRYSKRSLTNRLQESGFRVEKIAYVNALLFPIVYLKRTIERLFNFEPKSEVIFKSILFNQLIYSLYRVDLKISKRVNYPFGINIVAYAVK